MAIELKLSTGRVVQMRELTAEQQKNADITAALNAGGGVPQAYYRIASALAKLDEQTFAEAGSDLDLETRIDLLDASEFNELVGAAVIAFSAREIKCKKGEWHLTSGKKVRVLAKQTARQQMNADGCADFPVAVTYYRIAAIIESINGEFMPEVDRSKLRAEFDRRLKGISARDYQELQQAYNAGNAPSQADIKNV